jgi:hypothetical protein
VRPSFFSGKILSPVLSRRYGRTIGVRGGLADGLRCRPLASPYENGGGMFGYKRMYDCNAVGADR